VSTVVRLAPAVAVATTSANWPLPATPNTADPPHQQRVDPTQAAVVRNAELHGRVAGRDAPGSRYDDPPCWRARRRTRSGCPTSQTVRYSRLSKSRLASLRRLGGAGPRRGGDRTTQRSRPGRVTGVPPLRGSHAAGPRSRSEIAVSRIVRGVLVTTGKFIDSHPDRRVHRGASCPYAAENPRSSSENLRSPRAAWPRCVR